MIKQEEIGWIIDSQRESFLKQDPGLKRDALANIPIANSFATIITGMRGAGKTTLLLQLLHRSYQDAIYLNFEDIRLCEFETDDFERLFSEIKQRETNVLFFDEILPIKGWEACIDRFLQEGYKVYITSSNASTCSIGADTPLAGRYLSMELFPFSYSEYLRFYNAKKGKDTVMDYIKRGGMPLYLKTGIAATLNTLVDDIVFRDIAGKHSLRDIFSIRRLAAFLITNISQSTAGNYLIGMFNIKAHTTVLEYFSLLENTYLVELIQLINQTLTVQSRHPRRVYVADMGIFTENALTRGDHIRRRLENFVYLQLRRRYKHIFYYKDKQTCDFVVLEKNEIKELVQVCLRKQDEEFDTKCRDLLRIMRENGVDEGTIITLNHGDTIAKGNKTIKVIPASDFLRK